MYFKYLRVKIHFPMKINGECGFESSPATDHNSHVRIFISLLLQALVRTALHEFTPLACWSQTENLLNTGCQFLCG